MHGKESIYSSLGFGGCGGGSAETAKEWGQVLLVDGRIGWIKNTDREQSQRLVSRIKNGGSWANELIPICGISDTEYEYVRPEEVVGLI